MQYTTLLNVLLIFPKCLEIIGIAVLPNTDSVGSTPNDWVLNSNKIALGYDPSKGDPVCFTGDCRMAGFGKQIFKLNYTKKPVGSCLSQLIPEHVELVCMPSTEMRAKTQVISTFDELKESISQGVESRSGFSFGLFSFNYGKSEQTTKMINDIYIWNYTLYYTYVRESFIRLTSYAPMMELSDNFRSVIEQIQVNSDLDQRNEFIRRRLFEDFGYAYISELQLGGVAQQLITIEQQMVEKLRKEGYQITKEVDISFILSFNQKQTESYEKEIHSKFMNSVKNVKVSTIGGRPYAPVSTDLPQLSPTLNDWAQSVPSNPAIIKLKLESILDLITSHYFPNDTQINEKARAVEQALIQYANEMRINCYRSCTSPANGICETSNTANPFMFGTCKCNPRYTGPDCATPIDPTVPTPPTTRFI